MVCGCRQHWLPGGADWPHSPGLAWHARHTTQIAILQWWMGIMHGCSGLLVVMCTCRRNAVSKAAPHNERVKGHVNSGDLPRKYLYSCVCSLYRSRCNCSNGMTCIMCQTSRGIDLLRHRELYRPLLCFIM
jgi:hypothetical protein